MNQASAKTRKKLYTPEMQLRDLGIAEGKKKGIVEGKKETARKMKAEGISVDLIRRVTDLPLSEIEAL